MNTKSLFAMALDCYQAVVIAGHQSPDRQSRFLKDYLDICSSSPAVIAEKESGSVQD